VLAAGACAGMVRHLVLGGAKVEVREPQNGGDFAKPWRMGVKIS